MVIDRWWLAGGVEGRRGVVGSQIGGDGREVAAVVRHVLIALVAAFGVPRVAARVPRQVARERRDRLVEVEERPGDQHVVVDGGQGNHYQHGEANAYCNKEQKWNIDNKVCQ